MMMTMIIIILLMRYTYIKARTMWGEWGGVGWSDNVIKF